MRPAALLPRRDDRLRGSPTSVSDPMLPLSFEETCRSTSAFSGRQKAQHFGGPLQAMVRHYSLGVPKRRAFKNTQTPAIAAMTSPMTVSTTCGLPTTRSHPRNTPNAANSPRSFDITSPQKMVKRMAGPFTTHSSLSRKLFLSQGTPDKAERRTFLPRNRSRCTRNRFWHLC